MALASNIFERTRNYFRNLSSSIYEYFFCGSYDLKETSNYEYDELQLPDIPDRKGDCPICIEPLQPAFSSCKYLMKIICLSTCKHTFHVPCIVKWLNINEKRSCPICRSPAPFSAQLEYSCPICDRPFYKSDVSTLRHLRDVICLPKCRHKFHVLCIVDWLNLKDNSVNATILCPVCGIKAPTSHQLLQNRHRF